MIALVKYAKGRGNVELRDVVVPEIGEDDILLEVKAAGICGSDIGFYDGENASIVHPPVVLGHEFAGVVSRVGAKVKAWKPGDRVVDAAGPSAILAQSFSILRNSGKII
jgi:threonine dehydrogenase-like Zn-dependent dehydrogenase